MQDAKQELIDFIKENKNIEKPIKKTLYNFCNDCGICYLFNEDEHILTDANEVPNDDGTGWHYHGGSTYFYLYVLLDNNRLLSIREQAEAMFGDKESLRYTLYPNADKMIVNMVPGHSKMPYLNINYVGGEFVSEFYYEKVRRVFDYKNFNRKKITDILPVVSTDTIEERLNEGKKLIKKNNY